MSQENGRYVWPAFARAVIERALRTADPRAVPPPDCDRDPPHGGAFVSLHRFGRLRGCVGTTDAALALHDAVRDAAASAALHDPRFAPLTVAELADVRISVSILSRPQPWSGIDQLTLGVHGIIVSADGRRGIFLPQVALEHRMTAVEFISRCCAEKAGLPPDAWREGGVEVMLFTTRVETE